MRTPKDFYHVHVKTEDGREEVAYWNGWAFYKPGGSFFADLEDVAAWGVSKEIMDEMFRKYEKERKH